MVGKNGRRVVNGGEGRGRVGKVGRRVVNGGEGWGRLEGGW